MDIFVQLFLYFFGNLLTVGILGMCCLGCYCCCQLNKEEKGEKAANTKEAVETNAPLKVEVVRIEFKT
jgi:hypothetical protein